MFFDAVDEVPALLEEPEDNEDSGENGEEKKEISITRKVLVSELRGAVNEITKVASNARKCPCYNHSLNNFISQTSRVKSIRNLIGVIKETVSYLSTSAKSTVVLRKYVGHQLIGETR
ncbi:Hypothetical protein CINCED_3A021804 [Cinara cedri]|uniref:Uncharacterized protein n=1 Tax=Cinara cedri TaxID=506608 RepID=A0A5E4MFP5_9HEMI|nr:Hypothetical protein CINCED_3A021804 [Cinara cedri]